MWQGIRADLRAVLAHDPAARTLPEVLLCYPGFKALTLHRFNHWLWHRAHLKLLARILSQIGRFWTGIEIHPGAEIGDGVFIDHGTGIVIGETAIVGDDVRMYHGVTLGGTGTQRGRRHPIIGNGVLLGAHAIILGPITIGAGAKIAAGAVVHHCVTPRATVIGVPPNQRIYEAGCRKKK